MPYDEHGSHSRPFRDVMETVVNRLTAEAKDRIARRRLVEERWLADVAQYEGRDNQKLIDRLAARRSMTPRSPAPGSSRARSRLKKALLP